MNSESGLEFEDPEPNLDVVNALRSEGHAVVSTFLTLASVDAPVRWSAFISKYAIPRAGMVAARRLSDIGVIRSETGGAFVVTSEGTKVAARLAESYSPYPLRSTSVLRVAGTIGLGAVGAAVGFSMRQGGRPRR